MQRIDNEFSEDDLVSLIDEKREDIIEVVDDE